MLGRVARGLQQQETWEPAAALRVFPFLPLSSAPPPRAGAVLVLSGLQGEVCPAFAVLCPFSPVTAVFLKRKFVLFFPPSLLD